MEGMRIVEVRLIVAVIANRMHPELVEELAAAGNRSSVAEVVAAEVVSNLESIGYVEAVVVSRF